MEFFALGLFAFFAIAYALGEAIKGPGRRK